MKLDQNDLGKFAFICYCDKENQDGNVGRESAKRAIEKLHGMKVFEDEAIADADGEIQTLIVLYHKKKHELER